MMMRKSILLMTFCLFGTVLLPAQTVEELTQQKLQKEAELTAKDAQLKALTGEVDALKAEVHALTDLITPYPRWNFGLDGTLGFNFSSYTDWFSKAEKSTNAFNFGFAVTGWAGVDQRKWFWKNKATLTLGWLKFDDRDVADDDERFRVASDALNVQSLYGYKLTKSLAVSALADYRTAMLDARFNNPAFLDLGVGVTWTPVKNLVAVFHPLNYNLVFSRDTFEYKSTTGCKIVVDYNAEITKNLRWKTNLSAFASYEGLEFSNWTWTNGFSTAVRGVGIGFDFALRQNEQEARAFDPLRTDNPLQTYFILGITYAIKT